MVVFDGEVQGPIESIQAGQDGDSQLLVILGVSVIVERTGTVFDGVSFDALAVGDVLEISGFPENGGIVRATRVEKKGVAGGATEVELKGIVANLAGETFTLGQYTVDFSAADLSDIPGASLADGASVEVYNMASILYKRTGRLKYEPYRYEVVVSDFSS